MLRAGAVGLGFALVVVATVRAVHASLVPDVPIDPPWVNAVALAVAALALARSFAVRPRAGRSRLSPATTTATGVALVTLSVAVWCNLGTVQLPYHHSEQFHYFIGGKYFPELGYKHIYQCTAVAEAERFGREQVARRVIHDLDTDELVPATVALADPDACHRLFTPARWRQFADDIAWLRLDCPSSYWERVQGDHGFNPPPAWTVTGWTLASLAPASTRTLGTLALIDWGLLAIAFGMIGWAFGVHVLTVAVIVWGCNFPGTGVWTIGGFLRQDWFCALVASVCLARRGRWLGSGATLATSAALRVFPGLLLAMPAAVAVRRWHRTGRVAPAHRRFALGVVLGATFWVGSATMLFGWHAWPAFAAHIAHHRNAPLANDVGLRALLSQTVERRVAVTEDDQAVDPFRVWRDARRETFAARRPAYLALLAGVAGLVVVASRRMTRLWCALAASVVVVTALVDLASYYYALVVLLALLSATSRAAERLALGAIVLERAVNAWPWLASNVDIRYLLQSAVIVPWTALAVVAAAHMYHAVGVTPAGVAPTVRGQPRAAKESS